MNLVSNYKRAVTETIEMLLYYVVIETLYYRNYTLDTPYTIVSHLHSARFRTFKFLINAKKPIISTNRAVRRSKWSYTTSFSNSF